MNQRKKPIFLSNNLVIRMAEQNDIPALLEYYHLNKDHFSATDPPRPAGFFTEEYWQKRIDNSLDSWNREQGLHLVSFEKNSNTVVGTLGFSQIFRAAFQACYLGFGIGKNYQGKGLMKEALSLSIQFVFEELNLHRIMTNHLPENMRSANLLRSLGFAQEGIAKEYLYINGQWRDHVLNSLTNKNWKNTF